MFVLQHSEFRCVIVSTRTQALQPPAVFLLVAMPTSTLTLVIICLISAALLSSVFKFVWVCFATNRDVSREKCFSQGQTRTSVVFYSLFLREQSALTQGVSL